MPKHYDERKKKMMGGMNKNKKGMMMGGINKKKGMMGGGKMKYSMGGEVAKPN